MLYLTMLSPNRHAVVTDLAWAIITSHIGAVMLRAMHSICVPDGCWQQYLDVPCDSYDG